MRYSVSPRRKRAIVSLAFAAVAACAAAFGAIPQQLDSQVVLTRYERALLALPTPAAAIFSYTVTQAGPHALDQTHRIYRSGELVRDETVMSEGQTLRRKPARIGRYRDRYAIDQVAPHGSDYNFLLLRAVRSGAHYDYIFETVPVAKSAPYLVDRITIDGRSFLPVAIAFTTTSGTMTGKGELEYAKIGRYLVPTLAVVSAEVAGKPARERIAFNGYQFPKALPPSTFRAPRPLPAPSVATF
jgi:hypothetical protein